MTNITIKTLEAAAAAGILAGLAVLGSQLGLHYIDGWVVGSAAIAGFVGKIMPDQLIIPGSSPAPAPAPTPIPPKSA